MTRVNSGGRGQPKQLHNGPDLRMLSSVPTPPTWFDAARQKVWTETAGVLVARADLSEGDLLVLESFSHAVVEFRDSCAVLQREGLTITGPRGATVPHPVVPIKKGAEIQMATLAAALGLSPASRRALKYSSPGELPGHSDKPQRGF